MSTVPSVNSHESIEHQLLGLESAAAGGAHGGRARALFAAGAAALLFVGAGCSGSDDSSDAADTGDETSEVADEAPESESESESASEAVDDDAEVSSPLDPVSGGGVITLDGVAYEFEAESCDAVGGVVYVTGPVTTDGEPIWAIVSGGDSVDEDGDGTPDQFVQVALLFGETGVNFTTDTADERYFFDSGLFPDAAVDFTVTDSGMSGTGELFDVTGLPADESFLDLDPATLTALPASFEASCD